MFGCIIDLLRETAENRGFLWTDLETILLSFFFGILGSSLSSKSFGEDARVEYDTLQVPSSQSRVQVFRPFGTLRCSSYFSKTRSYARPFYLSFFLKQLFHTTNQLIHRLRSYSIYVNCCTQRRSQSHIYIALGFTSCYINFSTYAPRAIISIEY